MAEKVQPPADDYKIRCPRLGHQINFLYCRHESMGRPCPKSLDCWFEHFQVEEYLKGELTEEEWESLFCARPKAKMTSLLELIEQAKDRKNRPHD
jgi:hypothetical protein